MVVGMLQVFGTESPSAKRTRGVFSRDRFEEGGEAYGLMPKPLLDESYGQGVTSLRVAKLFL